MSEPAPTPAPDPTQQVRILVGALYLAGVITIAVGIAVGIVVDPVLFVIAVVGLGDFWIARMFASGRIGPLAAQRKAAASGEAGTIAEADPSFNPYARED